MHDEYMDELEKASVIPDCITLLTKEGANDPLSCALETIDQTRKLNLQRKIEKLLQEESLTMSNDELKEWKSRMLTAYDVQMVIQVTIDVHFQRPTVSFTSMRSAAHYLYYKLLEYGFQKEDNVLEGSGLLSGIMATSASPCRFDLAYCLKKVRSTGSFRIAYEHHDFKVTIVHREINDWTRYFPVMFLINTDDIPVSR